MPPGTLSTGFHTGELISKREKVDREVKRCCQCTRHSTWRRTCACKDRVTACMNCMCILQRCNKVPGKPSPATLHRFFITPEKSITKPALALAATTKIDLQEEGTGEAITTAPPKENREDDGEGVPEDTEVGAKAAPSKEQGDISLFGGKTDRQRRKAKRALQRARKAKRQLCLAPVVPYDGEVEGPAAGRIITENREKNRHRLQLWREQVLSHII